MSDWKDKLPEGAIINAEIHIYQWIDPIEGDFRWQCFYESDLFLSSQLGLLEMTKQDILYRARKEQGFDNED